MDNASWVGSGFLFHERGYGLIDAIGGNAGSWIAWVEGRGGDIEGGDMMAGLGHEGYLMGVVPFT